MNRMTKTFAALAVFAGLFAAAPLANAQPSVTVTVNRPVCYMEDGSDAAVLPCVWTDPDTGTDYLTYADGLIRIAR